MGRKAKKAEDRKGTLVAVRFAPPQVRLLDRAVQILKCRRGSKWTRSQLVRTGALSFAEQELGTDALPPTT